ncbi:hypothetical protein FNV43_RR03273 [Rhamnella rubrinervis]|uniref:non-specific serine/threonine protein kinase n=1 Tax=Rhamnella rubrinervis TaxID=2594499 RepID=A0A8K0MPG1_9ROSA|nr:hypothetical protein FNV43_RR03273 [Rhamnella rubrinervis]
MVCSSLGGGVPGVTYNQHLKPQTLRFDWYYLQPCWKRYKYISTCRETVGNGVGNIKIVFISKSSPSVSQKNWSAGQNPSRDSYNSLSGNIPPCLASSELRIDLSCNSLEGQVPYEFRPYYRNVSFLGNAGLCGDSIYGILPCSQPKGYTHKNIVKISVLVFILTFIASLFQLILVHKFVPRNKESLVHDDASAKNGDIFSIWNYDGRIAYEDITQATEDFDIKYCVGTGSYGSVYRAQLPNGKVVALKKLHGSEAEEPSLWKSFMSEVKSLSEIKHRNIIKLHGFCLHQRCMFLIYEYMERGSLFCMLSNNVEAVELNWKKRVTIIKDIAHALCYMHHDCNPPIVHRDVSSSNILLNSALEAFASDFGTARFLHHDASNQTIHAGTYGCIAPVSSSAASASQNIMLREVLDQRLPVPTSRQVVQDVFLIATLAFACIHANPKHRPTMKRISRESLIACRAPLAGNFHDISLGDLMKNSQEYTDDESEI